MQNKPRNRLSRRVMSGVRHTLIKKPKQREQNVFSSKDAGLRLAMNNFGFVKPESRWTEYDKYAEKWKPFKTTACIHLWKTVD